MLRLRQKRRVTFANPQARASSSKTTIEPPTIPTASGSTSKSGKPKSKRSHKRPVSASTRVSQQTSNAAVKVSNHQRRLASLFMALMASSPLPIEADAETLEAAQKASSAPKTPAEPKRKRRVSIVSVQEIRAGRWKRFRHELNLKIRKGKSNRYDEFEMDDLIELIGEERWKSDDMV